MVEVEEGEVGLELLEEEFGENEDSVGIWKFEERLFDVIVVDCRKE